MPERTPSDHPASTTNRPPAPGRSRDLPEETERADLEETNSDRVQLQPRIWSLLTHLSMFVIPVLGPLLILGLQKNILGRRSALITHHGKQAAVWQVAAIIIGIATVGIGAVIMSLITLYAAVQAGQGERYTYPLIGDYARRALSS